MKTFIKDNAVMLHKILTALADNLVKVFVPLLILKKNDDLKTGLIMCVVFLCVYSLLTAVLNYVLYKPLKFKPLTMILLHIIPVCALQFIISLYNECNFLIILVYAVLLALGQTFYSVASNNYFLFENQKTNAGKMSNGTSIGKIIMILIGGFILSSNDIGYITIICIIASVFYILSIVPLFFIKDNYDVTLKAISEDTQKSCDKTDKKYYRIYHISFGIYQALMDTVIPVFLYINNLNFNTIVYIMAVIEVIKVLVTIIAQKIKSEKMFRISVVTAIAIFCISTITIYFIKNNLIIYIFSVTISATFPLIFIPFMNRFCGKIKNTSDPQKYMSIRDVEIFSLRIILFALMLVGDMLPAFMFGILSAIIIAVLPFCKNFS